MMTVQAVLAVLALVLAAVSATGWAPLWVSVVLLAVLALLQHIPLGR